MKPNDPPAYPISGMSTGITMRDFFAAHALCVFLADDARDWDKDPLSTPDEYIARASYRIADAMLKERERTDGEA